MPEIPKQEDGGEEQLLPPDDTANENQNANPGAVTDPNNMQLPPAQGMQPPFPNFNMNFQQGSGNSVFPGA